MKGVSTLEETILNLLVGREMYGLEILEATKIKVSSLYPALHKMEMKGLVSSRWGEETPKERGGARRRYYTATRLGERVLSATQMHEK